MQGLRKDITGGGFGPIPSANVALRPSLDLKMIAAPCIAAAYSNKDVRYL